MNNTPPPRILSSLATSTTTELSRLDGLQDYLSRTSYVHEGNLLIPVASNAMRSQSIIPSVYHDTPDPTLTVAVDPADLKKLASQLLAANGSNGIRSIGGSAHLANTARS